jgi:hypothetical protein
MKSFLILTGLALALAGCSSTKITSTPHAGYRMHESMVMIPLTELGELENHYLMTRAAEMFSKELIFLNIIPYQDAVYKTSQLGLKLPAYNCYDTAQLGMLHRKANIQYILTGDLVSIKSEDFDKNSLDYNSIIATLNFQLLDAIHQTAVWQCTVRFTAKPVPLGSDPEDSFNFHSEDFAVHKAYHKAMKRLTKNFELIPNRPGAINE